MSEHELQPGWQSNEIAFGMVRFYGEQVGVRETRLKGELSKFFSGDWRVKAAYLAKMGISDDPPNGYALCLVVAYGCYRHPQIMEPVGQIYAGLFEKREEMSIVFPDEDHEEELARICPPFYTKPGRDADLFRDGLPLTGIICPHCADGTHRILLALRSEPGEKGDSGWQFYCKSGVEENVAEAKILTLKEIVKLEPTLRGWLETPVGMTLWRPTGKSRWERIVDEGLNGNGQNGHGTNGNGNGHYNGNGHNGNGMHLPNGEVSFVRETGKAIDRGYGPSQATPLRFDDDPIREYITLKPGWPHPIEIALYYECFGCGVIISSADPNEIKCRCGNIHLKGAVITIKELAKAQAFRQR